MSNTPNRKVSGDKCEGDISVAVQACTMDPFILFELIHIYCISQTSSVSLGFQVINQHNVKYIAIVIRKEGDAWFSKILISI